MQSTISVAILGATGYVGLELIGLLEKHPNVVINFLGTESSPNKKLSLFDIRLKDNILPVLSLNTDFDPSISQVVFLALPHGISHKYVNKLYNKIKIIDLSADFRLDDIQVYSSNYGEGHSNPSLLKKFVYGLPEINKLQISQSSNIAVPGCYPTSVLLPLIPLLKKDVIKTENIIIDSKSGYSGAGKKFDIKSIKNNSDFNFYNYNTNNHRHMCEIQQELNKYSSKEIDFSFNPHILPIYRGMMSTIYLDINNNKKINNVSKVIFDFYKDNIFVELISNDLKFDFFLIQNTNKCLIKIYKTTNSNKVIIVSLIDNLLKGAAGQSVQCFNLMYDLDEKLGLL